MTEVEILKEIMKVLNDWNPLGNQAKSIPDLNEYESEANDIIYFYDDDLQFPKYKDKRTKVLKVVRAIINEAFNLNMTEEECKIPSEKIYHILFNQTN
jgi:hypothetical protein